MQPAKKKAACSLSTAVLCIYVLYLFSSLSAAAAAAAAAAHSLNPRLLQQMFFYLTKGVQN